MLTHGHPSGFLSAAVFALILDVSRGVGLGDELDVAGVGGVVDRVTLVGAAGFGIGYVGVGELLAIFAPSFHVAAIGMMLLLVILFMPMGLVPYLTQHLRRTSRPAAPSTPLGEAAE